MCSLPVKFHWPQVQCRYCYSHFGVTVLQLTRPHVPEVRMLVRTPFPLRPSVRVALLLCTTHCGRITAKDATEHMQSFRQEWPKWLASMTIIFWDLVIKLEAVTFLRPGYYWLSYKYRDIVCRVAKETGWKGMDWFDLAQDRYCSVVLVG